MPDRLGAPLPAPLFNRLAIIGLGLIGSSLARAARARNLAAAIVAIDASETVRDRVTQLNLADTVTGDTANGVRDADFIILCVPVGACGSVAETMRPGLAKGAIISDVGSVKGSIVAQIAPHLPANVHFVPAHPVAGTEYSGPDAGFSTLFLNRWCILTPPDGTDPAATAKVRAFWEAIGSNVEEMSPAHHDRVLAITSHLPHLIAFTICGTADDLGNETRQEVVNFAASGFRDFTRIAASDPVMWRDIFLNNREAVLEMLARFTEDAQAMARAIRWGDTAYIEDKVERGRKIRRSLIEQKQA